MEEKKEKLYIPLNVPDTADFMAGIGSKELSIIGCSLVVSVIVAIFVYSLGSDIVVALMCGAMLLACVIVAIRRDQYQECLIDKIKIVIAYTKAQKQYVYEYYNIYEGEKNG